MKPRGRDESSGDEDWEYGAEHNQRSFKAAPAAGRDRRAMIAQAPRNAGRSRPTNNQLLYKAYFRWNHYGFKLRNGAAQLHTETDACPSVTAAFLQVLHTLSMAENNRVSDRRNILHMLSTNTRRTKVVELSTGTHRVPDELRKHYLSDGEGGQYSTNLDRNRYGNDDQYLFTVIRYDLEYLNVCPCMVDVEIIDAKNDHQSIFVSAGPEACICHKDGGYMMRPEYPPRGAPREVVPVAAAPVSAGREHSSPRRSGSGVSQLFDALIMAATGGTEGAAAAAVGGEPPVDSRGVRGGSGGAVAAAAAAAANATAAPASMGPSLGGPPVGGGGSGRQHPAVGRQRSRLFSALSYGDVDSLQNALDAFRAEDEIASGPGLSDVAGGPNGPALPSDSFRKRQRKPVRGPSSSMLAAFDSSMFGSLLKGSGLSGLREKSGDNAGADVISSGHAPPGPAGSGPGAAGSQEDDSEPVEGGRGGDEAEGGMAPNGDMEGMGGPPGTLPLEGEGEADAEVGEAGAMNGVLGHPPRRVRHVPRQSSAANLSVRTGGPAEVKRLAAEVEGLRAENRRLQAGLAERASYSDQRMSQLEEECHLLRQQVLEHAKARRSAEEAAVRLSQELANTRATANQVLQRVLQLNNAGLAAQLQYAAAAGQVQPQAPAQAAGEGEGGAGLGLHPFLPPMGQAGPAGLMQPGQGLVNGAASMAAAAAASLLSGGSGGLPTPQQMQPGVLPPMHQLQPQQQQQQEVGSGSGGNSGSSGGGGSGGSGGGIKRGLDDLIKAEELLEASGGGYEADYSSHAAKRQALEAAAAAATAAAAAAAAAAGPGPSSAPPSAVAALADLLAGA